MARRSPCREPRPLLLLLLVPNALLLLLVPNDGRLPPELLPELLVLWTRSI